MARNMERPCTAVINEVIKAGYDINVVYDIGANVGRWTQEWRKHIPNAKYIMFEANPNNKCAIPLNNDMYMHQVLSDADDRTVEFFLANIGKASTGDSYYKELTVNYSEGKSVLLTTKKLNTVIEKKNLPLPDFIKMDTQGAEVDIINGGSDAMEHAKVAILEMPIMPYNKGAPNFSKYIDTMYANGFIPTGVDHIAMRHNVVNQMDIVFIKADINHKISGHKNRYRGF